jgi:hypothetical protein
MKKNVSILFITVWIVLFIFSTCDHSNIQSPANLDPNSINKPELTVQVGDDTKMQMVWINPGKSIFKKFDIRVR